MKEIYYPITMVNIAVTLVILVITIIAFIFILKEQKHNTLPKKIELNCSNCNKNNLSIQTLKINPYTEAHGLIKMGLYICVISFILNLIITFLVLLESDEMYDFIFAKEIFDYEHTEFVTSILVTSVLMKLQGIIFAINIVMNFIASLIKKDAIITVCKDCGAVKSYFK